MAEAFMAARRAAQVPKRQAALALRPEERGRAPAARAVTPARVARAGTPAPAARVVTPAPAARVGTPARAARQAPGARRARGRAWALPMSSTRRAGISIPGGR